MCSYMYGKSAPALSCMATTETGQMVMGSRKGEIRLFSDKTFNRDIDPLARLKPRAKTTLPGLGGMMVAVSLFFYSYARGLTICTPLFRRLVRRPHHWYRRHCRWQMDSCYLPQLSARGVDRSGEGNHRIRGKSPP
jgi:hypothetical protein